MILNNAPYQCPVWNVSLYGTPALASVGSFIEIGLLITVFVVVQGYVSGVGIEEIRFDVIYISCGGDTG